MEKREGGMRYNVSTTIGSSGRIISTIDEIDDCGVRVTLFRHVLNTQDAQVRAALEMQGWRHDGGIAAIDVPNRPSVQDPLGTGHHRVTMTDIITMERKLNALKRAFNS